MRQLIRDYVIEKQAKEIEEYLIDEAEGAIRWERTLSRSIDLEDVKIALQYLRHESDVLTEGAKDWIEQTLEFHCDNTLGYTFIRELIEENTKSASSPR